MRAALLLATLLAAPGCALIIPPVDQPDEHVWSECPSGTVRNTGDIRCDVLRVPRKPRRADPPAPVPQRAEQPDPEQRAEEVRAVWAEAEAQAAANEAALEAAARAKGFPTAVVGLDTTLISAVQINAPWRKVLVFVAADDDSTCMQALPGRCLFRVPLRDGTDVLYWLRGAGEVLEGAELRSLGVEAVEVTGVATHRTLTGTRQAFTVRVVR